MAAAEGRWGRRKRTTANVTVTAPRPPLPFPLPLPNIPPLALLPILLPLLLLSTTTTTTTTTTATVAAAAAAIADPSSPPHSVEALLLREEEEEESDDDDERRRGGKQEKRRSRHDSRRRRRNLKVAPLNVYLLVKDEFDDRRDLVEGYVFRTLDAFSTVATAEDDKNNNSNINNNNDNGGGGGGVAGTSPSRLYTYSAFFESLRSFSVSGVLGESYHAASNQYVPGYANSNDDYVDDPSNAAFYLSQDDPDHPHALAYAVANVCAFLANAMAESIRFDACEELNGMPYGGHGPLDDSGSVASASSSSGGLLSELGGVDGRYFPMSNACGQFGQSYQDGECPAVVGEAVVDASCPVDPDLEVTAVPHPRYNHRDGRSSGDQSPPPPFACLPKSFESDHAGYWDGYDVEFIHHVAYPSSIGAIDVEGCCFWGRGALMTRGTCGLGRLDHSMGRTAYEEGRPSRYPQVDFCRIPSLICGANTQLLSGAAFPELKWAVGMFEWVDRVQSYEDVDGKWSYLEKLRAYVDKLIAGTEAADDDNGFTDEFADDVGSLVARGCVGRYCSQRTVHFAEERRRNFEYLVREVFDLGGGGWATDAAAGESRPRTPPPPKYDFEYASRWLDSRRSRIEGNVLVSKNGAVGGASYFSREYRFENLMSALLKMAYFGVGDARDRRFLLSDEKDGLRGLNAGLVNLAFFLANAMAESIANDSCDEVHWDRDGSRYSLANSCGQNGRDYGTETCPPWQTFMACDVDTNAEIWADVPMMGMPPFMLDPSPPPFQCRPGSDPAGYYDEATQTLVEYDGDSGDASLPNSHGRTDIEGCCFWGRGALLTRGSCNYGKLNWHIGASAAEQGRPSLYPRIDFCTTPEAICAADAMDMRFVVAMFEWIDRVQDYYDSTRNWSYLDELYKFVDGGMESDVFIDSVSSIVAQGCHTEPCASSQSIETNRFLYGLERRMNFKNIIKLVFELPVAPPVDNVPSSDAAASSPAEEVESTRRPTFRPTPKPTPYPVRVPPTQSPVGTSYPPTERVVTTRPTGSPIELSDITQLNDGETYTISNDASSFVDESLVVTKSTTIIIEEGGYIEAPLNSDWPAVRVSIASKLIGRGGYVNGSYSDPAFLEGKYEDGGEAIQVNNGQSGPETASFAEFYDGIYVVGGDAPDGIGGNALNVNGFGTETVIHGGHFIGGSGKSYDGLSLYVLNSAKVHVRGGSFQGEIKVERSASVAFYGCFMRNDTKVTGVFADESELDVTVKTFYGGKVLLIPVAEQICETAPSVSPTNFPTSSHEPTVPRPNCGDNESFSIRFIIFAVLLTVKLCSQIW